MSRRILLIEDEPLTQDIIRTLLQGQGYLVDVASDGFTALERARLVRYDVALIDYHLPEMDGYTLGRLLREQHPGRDDRPVLIGLTADRSGLAARRGSDAVFHAILPKPIRPADLFATIDRVCVSETQNQDPSGERAASADQPAPPDETRRAAALVWRSHGLFFLPKAYVSPLPTTEQSAALTLCFDLVGAEDAQCVILMERHGINEAVRAARRGKAMPLPIIALSSDHADICEGLFRIDDPASWAMLAARLGGKAPAPVALHEIAPIAVAAPAIRADQREPIASGTSLSPELARPAAASDLRALLLAGVRAPLLSLRRELAARPNPETVPSRGGDLTPQLDALDSVLLVVGTIADSLNMETVDRTQSAAFDPTELAESAVAMIRDSLPPGCVDLICQIGAGMPALLSGVADRLRPVLLTLLDDACAGPTPVAVTLHLDFDAGAGTLSFRLDRREHAGKPERDAAVIPLLRNLRFATLRRLVALMDGTLTQTDGQMLLSVPVQCVVGAPTRPRELRAEEPANVLVVDDGITNGKELTLLLTLQGHHVCRVGDAEAALFAWRSHDLVIFDLASGAEARLSALDAISHFQTGRPDVPVLVLADGLSAFEESRLTSSERLHVLPKPFSPDALEAAVADARLKGAKPVKFGVEAIDARVRDALAQALGEPAVDRLTGQLLAQVETLVAEPVLSLEGRQRLVELSGCASVLGLAELSILCASPQDSAAIRSAIGNLRDALHSPTRSAA